MRDRLHAFREKRKKMKKFESIRIPRRRVVPIPKRDYIPSREEIQRMAQGSNPRDAAMISILAESGMGVGSLVGLRYADIKEDFERKLIPLKINVSRMRGYITFIYLGGDAGSLQSGHTKNFQTA